MDYKTILEKLDSLVYNRFKDKSTLEEELSKLFDQQVNTSIIFVIEEEKDRILQCIIKTLFDDMTVKLYYIKDFGENIYITGYDYKINYLK